jgi:hypothetical protein
MSGLHRPRASARRARVVVLAVALAVTWSAASALWLPSGGGSGVARVARSVAETVVTAVLLLMLAGLLHAFARAWTTWLHRKVTDLGTRLVQWTRGGRIPHAPESPASPLGVGDRVALCVGLVLAGLDVVLTTLLLRDVFPESPYRSAWLEANSPGMAEWAFYVVVASFKTLLELWLGVLDAAATRARPVRLFVLGMASAFDAALALARGWVLADQGLTGPMVTTSNILFIGFGVAVPWVVAHTGRVLALALDPWLARAGLLGLLFAIPRWLLKGAVWLLVLAAAAPAIIVGVVLAVLGATWFALEGMVGLILGHDDPDHDPDHDPDSRSFAPDVVLQPEPPPTETPVASRRVAGAAW